MDRLQRKIRRLDMARMALLNPAMPTQDIAEAFGVTYDTAIKALREAGVDSSMRSVRYGRKPGSKNRRKSRPASLPKIELRNTAIALRIRRGESLQTVGDRYGMTRERARMIAKRYGVIASNRAVHGTVLARLKWCEQCWKYRHLLTSIGRWSASRYCSKACGRAAMTGGEWSHAEEVSLSCEWCGCTFKRSKWLSTLRKKLGTKHAFCTRDCYWEYRRVHPEEYSPNRTAQIGAAG